MDSEREEMWNAVIASFMERELLRLRMMQRVSVLVTTDLMEDLRQADGYALLTEHVLWGEDDNG